MIFKDSSSQLSRCAESSRLRQSLDKILSRLDNVGCNILYLSRLSKHCLSHQSSVQDPNSQHQQRKTEFEIRSQQPSGLVKSNCHLQTTVPLYTFLVGVSQSEMQR